MKKILFVTIFCLSTAWMYGVTGQVAAQEKGFQWQVAELTFDAARQHERPYEEVLLTCTFTGPDGREIAVEGFYDGNNRWKVRFCPDRPGVWNWKTDCNTPDDGLAEKNGTIDVGPAAKDGNPLHKHGGLLKVSENRRYLTYTDGTPFFWLGDTWWFCPSSQVQIQGSSHPEIESMFRSLIDKRKSQGFNIVHWASLGHFGSSGNGTFMKTKGNSPFTPSYWTTYDLYVQTANDAGIIPVIGFGFHTGLDAWSLEDLQFLWRYVIARYGSYGITWLICGEYNHDQGERAERIEKILQLGAFIKQRDPYKRAMTVHPWYFKGDTRDAWNCDWYDFVMWQGAHVGHRNVPPTSTYRDSAELGKPYLEGETQYEGIYGDRPAQAVTVDDVRRSAWHALQSGCCGYTYGAHGLWYPAQNAEDETFAKDWGTAKPWWEAMHLPGPDQLAVMRKFYEKNNWFRYRPETTSLLLEEGSRDATRPLLQVDDQGHAILYCPQGSGPERSIRWKTSNGNYEVRRFNPRTGEETAADEMKTVDDILTLPFRPDDLDWIFTLRKN